MTLVGSQHQLPFGEDPLEGRVNYLIGNDPSRWLTSIPTYGRVQFANVYSGIDLVYYGRQGKLEYDFIVMPGADPAAIRMSFEGQQGMELDASGNLILHTAMGDLVKQAPVIYQDSAAGRQAVEGHYVLSADGTISFAIGHYDVTRPLVIDPILVFSTYLGGNGSDDALALAVDADQNAYITGATTSTNLSTLGVFQPDYGGNGTSVIRQGDAFVTKLNAAGTAVVFTTYLGGAGSDWGTGIAVDGSKNVYVTGNTISSNFPLQNPTQSTFGGNTDFGDAFVAKLSPSGTSLLFSTYLGGSSYEQALGIAVDSGQNIYATGATASSNFPTHNALQSTFGGGGSQGDAYVTKFNSSNAIVYSTYFGGNSDEVGWSILPDSAGNAWVAGYTRSANFPTQNPFQSMLGGGDDGALWQISSDGSTLIYSSYFGGSGTDSFTGIARDDVGNLYLTGYTTSTNFPTLNPLQPSLAGGNFADAFVTKFNPTASALAYSTYLGGSGSTFGAFLNYGTGIAVLNGEAYVTGITRSSSFPTADPFQSNLGGDADAFVARLNASGTALILSSYLGGAGADLGRAIAVDAEGGIYVAGFTSGPFPTAAPIQPTGNGSDGFLTKIGPSGGGPSLIATTTTVVGAPQPSHVGQLVRFTATVAPASGMTTPSGAVAFFVDGTPFLTRDLVDGKAFIELADLAVGSHTIRAEYGGSDTFNASAGSVGHNVLEPGDIIPIVTGLARYGFHMQPTIINLFFNTPLARQSAEDPANYRLYAAGPDHRLGTPDDRLLPMRAIAYGTDGENPSVALLPAAKLPLGRKFMLIVRGGSYGIATPSGVGLDGDGDGFTGGDYTAILKRSSLAGPASDAWVPAQPGSQFSLIPAQTDPLPTQPRVHIRARARQNRS
jgi:hypothetical protein